MAGLLHDVLVYSRVFEGKLVPFEFLAIFVSIIIIKKLFVLTLLS